QNQPNQNGGKPGCGYVPILFRKYTPAASPWSSNRPKPSSPTKAGLCDSEDNESPKIPSTTRRAPPPSTLGSPAAPGNTLSSRLVGCVRTDAPAENEKDVVGIDVASPDVFVKYTKSNSLTGLVEIKTVSVKTPSPDVLAAKPGAEDKCAGDEKGNEETLREDGIVSPPPSIDPPADPSGP
ncbi:hypothetical protein HK102_002971, partial [Quaeritorhiza haematococci]